MAVIVRNKKSILQKLVLEVKYRFGFSYLDKCGATINRIMTDLPEWVLRSDQPNPQNAPLVSLNNGCQFNFGTLKYDFGLEKPLGEGALSDNDVGQFAEQVDSIAAIVHQQLLLEEFTRIGFRVWYLFGSESKEDSERWLMELGCYSISPQFTNAFTGDVESSNAVIIVSDGDRKLRFAFNGVERQAAIDLGESVLGVRSSTLHKGQQEHLQKQIHAKHRMRQNPEFAAMIDVDAFIENPETIDPKDFVETGIEQIEERLTQIGNPPER